MAGTCGSTFAKVILVIFNILFLCCGIVLICVGGWIVGAPQLVDPLRMLNDVFGSSFLRDAGILLITMGVFTFIVTAVGLFAAIKENVIALTVYIFLLVITMIGMISGGVVAIVFKDKIMAYVAGALSDSIKRVSYESQNKYYRVDSYGCYSEEPARSWDLLQDTFDCCGANTYEDYINNNFSINLRNDCRLNVSSTITPNVPLACCFKKDSTIKLTRNMTESFERYNCNDGAFGKGCTTQLIDLTYYFAPILIGIGLGFGFLQLFGIIFAVCLCQNPDD